MKIPLRILLVEDSEDDALFLVHELERANFEPTVKRVWTLAAMDAALQEENWDVVVCDHLLQGFTSFDALKHVHQIQPTLPCIVVSGIMGEETAVAVMKAGATDYVVKSKLARLAPSIERELREAEARRAAQTTRAYLAAIVESCEDAIIGKTLDGTILSWNSGAEAMYGYRTDEVKGRSVSMLLPPQGFEELKELYARIKMGEPIGRYETVRVRKDGKQFHVSLSLSPIKDASGKVIGVSAIERDITARKREEEVRLRLIEELTDALRNIKTLTGLLPICASCKKIRDDRGYWQKVELYISQHTGAEFTHGICPECIVRLYPEYAPARPRIPTPAEAEAERSID